MTVPGNSCWAAPPVKVAGATGVVEDPDVEAAATEVQDWLGEEGHPDAAATEVSVGLTAVETTYDGPVQPPKGPE